MQISKVKCRLCGKYFDDCEMSEEHFPAKCTGNNDIVSLDIIKMMDSLVEKEFQQEIIQRKKGGEPLSKITDDIFDNRLSSPLYPKGRTARTLCKECNTFLGKYDEAYLKFFNCYGDSKKVKGFSKKTKLWAIKSIYGKFLSIPETQKIEFDFLDFLRDENSEEYTGKWHLYCVLRDESSDIFGLNDIGTGQLNFPEGDVYEFSDDRFIFNLMNFKKNDCFKMTDIFDILNNNYHMVKGVGNSGGYHAQILMLRLFKNS